MLHCQYSQFPFLSWCHFPWQGTELYGNVRELDTEAWVSLVGGQWSVNENIPAGEHLKSIFYFNRKISVIVGWSCCWMTVAGWLAKLMNDGYVNFVHLFSFLFTIVCGGGWILSGREMNSCLSKVLRKGNLVSARVSKRWKMIVSLIGVSWILLKC